MSESSPQSQKPARSEASGFASPEKVQLRDAFEGAFVRAIEHGNVVSHAYRNTDALGDQAPRNFFQRLFGIEPMEDVIDSRIHLVGSDGEAAELQMSVGLRSGWTRFMYNDARSDPNQVPPARVVMYTTGSRGGEIADSASSYYPPLDQQKHVAGWVKGAEDRPIEESSLRYVERGERAVSPEELKLALELGKLPR